MNLKEGEKLVKYARKVIETKLENKKIPELKEFKEKLGVFVTLQRKGLLRGCIGFTEPVYQLNKAIKEAAQGAAFSDPRFLPMKKHEMKEITVEVSVLTKPKQLKVSKRNQLPDKIEIGKHGLIVRTNFTSGLLLPQVATEYNWGPEEFLGQTCQKAGLDFSAWLDPKAEIFTFESQIFKEEKPNEKVVEVKS